MQKEKSLLAVTLFCSLSVDQEIRECFEGKIFISIGKIPIEGSEYSKRHLKSEYSISVNCIGSLTT